MEWADGKFLECAHLQVKYPDKMHQKNWKLTERYYYFHRGKEGGRESEISETLAREASDAVAASSLLSLGDINPKGRGKGAPDRHKSLVTKVNAALAKVARILASCEASLPPLKRRVSPMVYGRLREGLAAARDLRESCLDQFEDLKVVAEGADMEDCIESLTKILQQLQEGQDTVQEAWRAHQPGVKKDKNEPATQGDAQGCLRSPNMVLIHFKQVDFGANNKFPNLIALWSGVLA